MDLLSPWFDAAMSLLPAGSPIWDAHTHTGSNDPDGVIGTPARLIEKLGQAGQAGAVVMTSHDPGGYPAANDRVLAETEESDGMLIPFLRVDPRLGKHAELEVNRSLDRGHRGIKLHPRAEEFRVADPGVESILRTAAERNVPVLIHAGRGIPSLGEDAVARCREIPGLRIVLAHAAISDLSWLARQSAETPGLYFDTAWWDITDLLALFAWAPPDRIVYASDTPYGHPMLGFLLAIRAAAASGYDATQLSNLFGANVNALLKGRDPEGTGPPPSLGLAIPPALLRLHANLQAAVVLAFARADATEPVSLARLACDVPGDDPHSQLMAAIAATLDQIDPTATRGIVRPLIALSTAALTPGLPVPG